jgi:hypothetical protein
MKMKGISIAMESIVYIILAVLVLTVLLYFFTSQAGPAEDRFNLEQKRSSLCGQYSRQDISCSDISRVAAPVVDELVEVCGRLKEKDCPNNRQKCVQSCCGGFTCNRITQQNEPPPA